MILLDGGGNGHFGLVGWRWERTLWSCGVEVGTDTLVLRGGGGKVIWSCVVEVGTGHFVLWVGGG